jgi:hypothetical protein
LLLPWWLRTMVVAALVGGGVFVGVAYARYESDGAPVPAAGIALMALGSLALAALIAAALGQGRDSYLEALSATSTPEERSQAIRAAWRGPIPELERVRQAAARLVTGRLDGVRKNWAAFNLIYPAMAVFWLWMAARDFAGHRRDGLLHATVALPLLWSTGWSWVSRRRLQSRLVRLRRTVVDADVAA